MNALAKLGPAPISSKLAEAYADVPDVTAAIGASYGVVKYKGKVWSIDYRGKQKIVDRTDEPGTPANAIDVVILDAALVKSKIYYPQGYAGEGSNEKPACWSSNGVTPAPASTNKQSNACATCPQNVSGSRVDENGVARGKACRDNIRLAVVPSGDLENETFGGPMLLRVPAASLADYADSLRTLRSAGIPFFGVVMKIKFDPQFAYPKFIFEPQRYLSDAEADTVLKLREDQQTKRIVNEEPAPVEPAPLALPGQPSAKLSEQAVAKAPPTRPSTAPVAGRPAQQQTAAASVAAAQTANTVVEEEPPFDAAATTGTSLDAQLDALLG